jgi:6-phosphofructokinase 1
MTKRIGILNGGGDCPGLNPAIRGVVAKAFDYGFEAIGISEGYQGLIEGKNRSLKLADIDEIIGQGGTILGTSRVNPFKTERGVARALGTIKRLKLDGLIVMGGEDTLGVAQRLYQAHKVKVIGVPKTMDNDLSATDYTFGFDSSVTIALDAAQRLKDTGKSHRRVMILEVMGRHAGWVALFTGIASAADWILLPEERVDITGMCQHLKKVYRRKHYALVVASEGIKIAGMKLKGEKLDQFGHMVLRKRRVGEELAMIIKERTGIGTRAAVMGHIQRGGSPTLFDRMLGIRCGVRAMELVAKKKFGRMVALKGNEIVDVPLLKAVAQIKTVDKKWRDLARVFYK